MGRASTAACLLLGAYLLATWPAAAQLTGNATYSSASGDTGSCEFPPTSAWTTLAAISPNHSLALQVRLSSGNGAKIRPGRIGQQQGPTTPVPPRSARRCFAGISLCWHVQASTVAGLPHIPPTVLRRPPRWAVAAAAWRCSSCAAPMTALTARCPSWWR